MAWVFFALGIVVGLLVALFVLMRYGKRRVYIPPVKPRRVRGVAELQPIVKALMTRGGDRDEFYVRSSAPRLLVRIRKRVYSTKSDVLVIEIRSSDENAAHYEGVRAALADSGVDFSERFTPKLRQPKDLKIREPVGTYAPPAVAGLLQTIFAAVGAEPSDGVDVSDSSPDLWGDA